MEILGAKHAWSERTPFTISRPGGLDSITFLHFQCEVELLSLGEIRTQPPHACIFYAPGQEQWFHCEKTLVHDWVHLAPSLMPLLDDAGIVPGAVYRPRDTAFISKIIRELELECFSRREDSDMLCHHKIRELIIKFARAVSEGADTPLAPDKYTHIRAVRRELLIRCREPWTVRDMAELAGMSPSRFHAVYSQAFSTSPMDDVISERISSAKNLLVSTNMSVAEIASSCGYENESHFIRQFRKRLGLSPGKYRKHEQ